MPHTTPPRRQGGRAAGGRCLGSCAAPGASRRRPGRGPCPGWRAPGGFLQGQLAAGIEAEYRGEEVVKHCPHGLSVVRVDKDAHVVQCHLPWPVTLMTCVCIVCCLCTPAPSGELQSVGEHCRGRPLTAERVCGRAVLRSRVVSRGGKLGSATNHAQGDLGDGRPMRHCGPACEATSDACIVGEYQ